jgi:hypothetical protein
MDDNVIRPPEFSRKETWEFPERRLTIEVNHDEPPLTVAQAIYFLGNVQHQIHRMMEPGE